MSETREVRSWQRESPFIGPDRWLAVLSCGHEIEVDPDVAKSKETPRVLRCPKCPYSEKVPPEALLTDRPKIRDCNGREIVVGDEVLEGGVVTGFTDGDETGWWVDVRWSASSTRATWAAGECEDRYQAQPRIKDGPLYCDEVEVAAAPCAYCDKPALPVAGTCGSASCAAEAERDAADAAEERAADARAGR